MSIVIYYAAQLNPCDYRKVWHMQHALQAYCRVARINALVLTQHTPVVTLGYRRPTEQLRLSAGELWQRGIDFVEVERGGGATYHGPGQLVVYPIFSSLVRKYGVRGLVTCLEEVMCRVSRSFGVAATHRPGFPGIWIRERKLGAVGIAVRGGVSLHGCALNVNIDLRPFSYIVPCGIGDKAVTNLQQESNVPLLMSAVEEQTRLVFAEVFDAIMEEMPDEWSRLERETDAGALDYH